MNSKNYCLALFCTAVVSPVFGADSLYLERFDTPSEMSYEYPVVKNYNAHLGGRLSAWSGNGIIRVCHFGGVGESGSGGVLLQVVQTGSDFATLTLKIPLTALPPDKLTVDELAKIVLVFSIKGTDGLQVMPNLQASIKNPKARQIPMPSIRLSDHWNSVRFPLDKAGPVALAAFVAAYAESGKAEWLFNIDLEDFYEWEGLESFQIDNIELTRSGT